MTYYAMVMQLQRYITLYDNLVTFDTYSGLTWVDNLCSGCISYRIENFEGQVIDSRRAIKVLGGKRNVNVKTGTIIWKWSDDDERGNRFNITNYYYIPDGKVLLLIPQNWEKIQKDIKPIQSTSETTVDNECNLFCNQLKHNLTITL